MNILSRTGVPYLPSVYQDAVNSLKAAQKVITNESSWTKNGYAFDAVGYRVQPDQYDACKYCTIGALAKVKGDVLTAENSLPMDYLRISMGSESFDDYVHQANDEPDTTHLHVMMSYDFAILMAQDDLKAAKKSEKK